jgi:phosphoserine phosphatase
LVSGGFTFFTERLKSRLGIDTAFSNTLEIEAGKLTGKLSGALFGAEQKRAAVIELCASLGGTSAKAIAIGDGANDLPMMQAAGLSVAFHAKPKVVAAADVAIRHGGLDVLLEWL